MTHDEAYHNGLLDHLQDRPTLSHTLYLAGESGLLLEYVRGLITGRRLLADAIPGEEWN